MPDTDPRLPLPLDALARCATGHLDGLEHDLAGELDLVLESAVLIACIRAPEGDDVDRYTVAFHANAQQLDDLPADARFALASSCQAAAAELAA